MFLLILMSIEYCNILSQYKFRQLPKIQREYKKIAITYEFLASGSIPSQNLLDSLICRIYLIWENG